MMVWISGWSIVADNWGQPLIAIAITLLYLGTGTLMTILGFLVFTDRS